MAEIGRKGARATARRFRTPGLDPEDLPKLRDHQAAKDGVETIVRAVASGLLSYKDATAAIRAVGAWLKVEGERIKAVELEELREKVEDLKATLKPRAAS